MSAGTVIMVHPRSILHRMMLAACISGAAFMAGVHAFECDYPGENPLERFLYQHDSARLALTLGLYIGLVVAVARGRSPRHSRGLVVAGVVVALVCAALFELGLSVQNLRVVTGWHSLALFFAVALLALALTPERHPRSTDGEHDR